MSEMSMNKAIHGAFRRDLDRFTVAAALAQTRASIRALAQSAGSHESEAAAHLDHEEGELEPVYQAKRDTPELKAMGKAFGRVSPARGGRFFAWLLDGASPEERAAVPREVPGPVLAVIGAIFGRGYRKKVAPVWKT